ncbi:choline ABC transporter substrate-binding protein [Leeia sp. TBRC 13508]|uniref:Choline ABC transporter substrate-binding protein n=1 Tax=Leeia speluncae TaxID=2884804 RepID=A0ABS8DAF3_9NEIS|nr:choline ABC transporter substrate-binding protein [Leeia speluncae]MCB6185180.1 choline ABC transporter substrate-binding protein [Leeia speluncae]
METAVRRWFSVAASVGILATSFHASAQDPAQCQNVKFGEVGWTDIAATTALASYVLKSIGYNPSSAIQSVPDTLKGLKNKQIDVYLGYWAPAQTGQVTPYVKSGDVKMLAKPNLVGAKYTLAVPSYAADAGLRSFEDLGKFKVELGYTMYGIEPGNEGNNYLNDMIQKNKFGLKDFMVTEWGEKGMLMAVKKAVEQKKFIAFLAWEPHPMNVDFKLTYLKGGDAYFGPNYGEAKVYTVLANDYLTRCPNVGKFVSNLQFTLDMENRVMGSIMNKVKAPQAAMEWLKKNPAVLKNWLNGVTTFDGKEALPVVMSTL